MVKPMIHVYALEKRTMARPGQAPVTIEREVTYKNGIGRKTVRVKRGSRTVSTVTHKLNKTEKRKVPRRKYIKGLYKPMERETLRQLNSTQ
jgi:hypothetical protein